jgi:hypothetical protein
MRIKRKKPRLAVGAVKEERVKTSMVVRRSILVKAQGRAQMEGLSLNGAFNQALYQWATGFRPASAPVSTSVFEPTAPDERRNYGQGRPKPLKPFPTEGFTRVAEGKDDVDCFADWETVRRYAKMNLQHPTDGPKEMAKRMGITIDEALAADIAQQTPEFDRYMRWRARIKEEGAMA